MNKPTNDILNKTQLEKKANQKAIKILKDLEELKDMYDKLHDPDAPYDGGYSNRFKERSELVERCLSNMKFAEK